MMAVYDRQSAGMGAFLASSMGNIEFSEVLSSNTTVETWTTNFYEQEWEKELDKSGYFIALYYVFVVMILIGNGSVFFLLMKVKRLHTITNYYIASLCVSDICVGVFAIPMEILAHYNEQFMSSASCQGLEYFVHVSLAANIYCLIIIAVDRHRNIVKPFLPKVRFRQCALNILIVWLVSFLQGWSAVVLYRIEVREHIYHGRLVLRHECTISQEQKELHIIVIWFNFITIYVAPLAILTGLYSRVFWTLHLSRMRVGAAQASTGSRKKRIVRMLAAIVLVFALCQFPVHVWRILVHAENTVFEGFLVVHQVFDMISFSNSWLNVVIYVSYNQGFRRAYRDVFWQRRPVGDFESQFERSNISVMPSTVSSIRPANSVIPDFDEHSVISANRSSGSKSSASNYSRNLSVQSCVSNNRNLSIVSTGNHRNLSISSRELPNGYLDSNM